MSYSLFDFKSGILGTDESLSSPVEIRRQGVARISIDSNNRVVFNSPNLLWGTETIATREWVLAQLSSQSPVFYQVQFVSSANFTVPSHASYNVIVADTTSNAVSITLPAANDVVNRFFKIFNRTSSNPVTISFASGDSVLGASTPIVLNRSSEFVEVLSVGQNIYIVVDLN